MAATVAATIQLDPLSHMRNQMKQSLVEIAESFMKYTSSKPPFIPSLYTPFSLFTANFEVDQNLNTLLIDSYHSYMEGEGHSEMVHLNDEIFGSTLKLLGHFNLTKVADPLSSDKDRPGGYEWLIQLRSKGKTAQKLVGRDYGNIDKMLSGFKYPRKHKAKDCLKS